MSDRGRGGRGRSTQQKKLENVQPVQRLPHAQTAASSEAIRRPGELASLPPLGTGRGGQRTGRGDGAAAIAHLGRGIETMRLQPSVAAGGDASDTSVAVSSTRGSCRGKRILPADIFVTKPQHITNKKGESGNKIMLKANYFKLIKKTNWSIQQYRVDFAPEEDRTRVRKGLLRLHKDKLGAYIFDGTVMYSCTRLPEKMVLASKRQSDDQHITITVHRVGEMQEGDIHFIQFFNIILRKCFDHLKLQQIGRDFYDPKNKVELPDYKLELWPGYITSIRQHEHDVLMCASITFKVMRQETLLDILKMLFRENRQTFQHNFSKAVIGSIVLTHYNNNTYRIEDVDFNTTPNHSFRLKTGEDITYVQYYKKKYEIIIRDLNQPMLVTRSKTKDRQAGSGEMVYLVPELCRATGLTDSMRDNYKLMSALSAQTRLQPGKRVEKLLSFHRRLSSEPNIVKELVEWNLKLDNKLIDVPARALPTETILFGQNSKPENVVNWSRDMQKKQCFVPSKLTEWCLIVTERDKQILQKFLDILIKVALGIGFAMDQPIVLTIRDDRPGTYSETLENCLSRKIPQMVFCVVSNNRSDRYSAIKKKCCVDRPVPSQVCLSKMFTHRNHLSIATNIAIQMNCKLGGAPWSVYIPLGGLMTIGFDVCHDTTIKGKDFAATVASLDKNMTKYFSTVDAHAEGEELSDNIARNICKAAKQFHKLNGNRLPANILIYRDGVGEGQVSQVMQREVIKIQQELDSLYGGPNRYKMVFVIVTKRLNTRLFTTNNANPSSGSVVDDIITSPIKYDFFLVSQQVREGTITPTNYSVIYDTFNLTPDHIQRLTYKMTHMYFNCTNTVRVPAPCHYAHKLAFLVSRFIHQAPNSQLQDKLYFL